MAKYQLNIGNYHAIKQANLILDGLTVVAGVNGCGKSTISRWLYYIVNGLSSLDGLLFSDFRSKIVGMFDKYLVLVDDLSRYTEGDKLKGYKNRLALMSSLTLEQGEEKMEAYFGELVGLLVEMLSAFLQKEKNPILVNRLLKALGLSSAECALDELKQKFFADFSEYSLHFEQCQKQRPLHSLAKEINTVYKEQDAFPENIGFEEDKVELLTERLGKIYGMNQAIYLGTPTAISLRQSDQVMLKSVENKILWPNDKSTPSLDIKPLMSLIEKMIGGYVVEREELGTVDLIYREKTGLEIKLEDVASGYKPLAYLLRLIKNGWLTERTLLEIDEPETNLHPSWVVEFAHFLVMIHKYLGTKILITSHHPDMVSAIRYISEKEGLLEHTNFYLAEAVGDSNLYAYKDLKYDIDPVFESFNKSFDMLQQYAGNYGEL